MAADDLIAKVFEGRYRIDRRVGKGGFGVVYEATHLVLGSRIALKFLRVRERSDASERSALLGGFLQEARLLAGLRHPNIVQVFDAGVDSEGRAWVAMEWCGGETLATEIARAQGRGRSVEATWRLLRPMIEALAYAHRNGIAHRDIKPSNVMLVRGESGDWIPRVIDFGIAKVMEATDKPGSIKTKSLSPGTAFTPAYAAPEQVARARTGLWTDVHAIGLVLTEVLVGRRPYGDDPDTLAVVAPERPTPARFDVDVGTWEPVLAKALALAPMARYADAGELLVALGEALGERIAIPRGVSQASTEAVREPSSAALANIETELATNTDVSSDSTRRGVESSFAKTQTVAPFTQAADPRASGSSSSPRGRARTRTLGAMGIVAMIIVLGLAIARSRGGGASLLPAAASSGNEPLVVPVSAATQTPPTAAVAAPSAAASSTASSAPASSAPASSAPASSAPASSTPILGPPRAPKGLPKPNAAGTSTTFW